MNKVVTITQIIVSSACSLPAVADPVEFSQKTPSISEQKMAGDYCDQGARVREWLDERTKAMPREESTDPNWDGP